MSQPSTKTLKAKSMQKITKRLWRFWWTYGPGSIGSIAKTMAKTYAKIKKAYPDASNGEVLVMTLISRYPFNNHTTNIVGQSLGAPAEEIVKAYGGNSDNNINLHNAIIIILSVEHPEISQISAEATMEINDIVDNIIRKYTPTTN